jgi:hypothetical protein
LLPVVSAKSRQFGFVVERFDFSFERHADYTTKLKCAAFAWQIGRTDAKDIVLFADADTCCLKPVRLTVVERSLVTAGKVGMAPDVVDWHCNDPSLPLYLTKEKRRTYVNSGVIFASCKSLPFFEYLRSLANDPRFLTGPFHDQELINYAFGSLFRDTLLLLDRKFNRIGSVSDSTVIAHLAGGAGWLNEHPRKEVHLRLCKTALHYLRCGAGDVSAHED